MVATTSAESSVEAQISIIRFIDDITDDEGPPGNGVPEILNVTDNSRAMNDGDGGDGESQSNRKVFIEGSNN